MQCSGVARFQIQTDADKHWADNYWADNYWADKR